MIMMSNFIMIFLLFLTLTDLTHITGRSETNPKKVMM